jgi:hypothetical protein
LKIKELVAEYADASPAIPASQPHAKEGPRLPKRSTQETPVTES